MINDNFINIDKQARKTTMENSLIDTCEEFMKQVIKHLI